MRSRCGGWPQADVDGHRDRGPVGRGACGRDRRDDGARRLVAPNLHEFGEEQLVVQRILGRLGGLARYIRDRDEVRGVRPGAYGDVYAAPARKLRPRGGLLVDNLARWYLVARYFRLLAELEPGVFEYRCGLVWGLAGELRHLRVREAGTNCDPDGGTDLGGLALAAGRVLGDHAPVVLRGTLFGLDFDLEAFVFEGVLGFSLGPALDVREVGDLSVADVDEDGRAPRGFFSGSRILLHDLPGGFAAFSAVAELDLEANVGSYVDRLIYVPRVLQVRNGETLGGYPANLTVGDASERGKQQEEQQDGDEPATPAAPVVFLSRGRRDGVAPRGTNVLPPGHHSGRAV